MTRGERAKQFLPFDAMKGLSEALRDREERHLREEKRELSEEQENVLSKQLSRLREGMTVRIYCYVAFHNVYITGKIEEFNPTDKFILLAGAADKLWFENIYSVKITEY
ncbi:MAG: YolD-like family protein [Clostridia bacterium]|nr:YolD-like family protein [Clostridia bacterium]